MASSSSITVLRVAVISLALFPLNLLAVPLNSSAVLQGEGRGRYKVYQLELEHAKQLLLLGGLEQMGAVDIWRHPGPANSTSDVMVDEESEGGKSKQFHTFLQLLRVKHSVLLEDLERFLMRDEANHLRQEQDTDGAAGLFDMTSLRLTNGTRSRRQNSDFGFPLGTYYGYGEIVELMRRVERSLPNRAQLRSIGQTSEGRPIWGIEFGMPSDVNRRIVWIDSGIHAREWTAVHAAIWFIQHVANELLKGDGALSRFLQHSNILILPCVNPDGYEYTRTEPTAALVRMWRKNRGVERCEGNRCCKGVDLNRNFDFRFGQTGTSFVPCSEIYHGAGAFSEPETQAIRDAVLNMRNRLVAFITMHAYSQMWIYPYSDRMNSFPPDIADLRAVAGRAVNAIVGRYGGHWLHGTGPEIIYAYAGGSADWVKQTAGIKYTYTIELRPSAGAWNGFVLERDQLIPAAQEAWDGIMVVIDTLAPTAAFPAVIPPQQTPANTQVAIVHSGTTSTINAQQPVQAGNTRCEDESKFCQHWLTQSASLCRESHPVAVQHCRRSCGSCT